MDAILIFANELGNFNLGPNVVIQNIIKNLPSKQEAKQIRFFLIFNKKYRPVFNIPESVEKYFYLEPPSYLGGFFKIDKIIKEIIQNYKVERIKILYPKPVFLPLKAEQYAFLYDLSFEEIYRGKSKEKLKKKYFIKKIIWRRLKKIFTISFASYQDITQLLGLDNLDWFYLGVDQEIFKVIDYKENQNFLEKFFYQKGLKLVKSYFFCPAGKIWYRKNILNLVKAFRMFCEKVKDDVYLIITANNIKDKNVYVKEVMENTFEKVIFLENLDTQELVNLYNGCLAVIYPSFYEGFGLPILEALSCGKHVLISKIKVFQEIYPSNEHWFNPDDIKDMANCMLNFYFRKEYFVSKRIIDRTIVEKFKWSTTVENLIKKMKE